MVSAFNFLPFGSLFLSHQIGTVPTIGLASKTIPTVTTRLAATSSSSSTMRSLPPILDVDGTPIPPSSLPSKLENKRVALYFSAGWCPMCTLFEPALLEFRRAASDSSKPIELIYVPSDRTASDAAERSSRMGMLSVPFDEADDVKRTHGVWSGAESIKLGVFGRRSGVPALVVLDGSGEEMAFVEAESRGVRALATWPLDDDRGVWGV